MVTCSLVFRICCVTGPVARSKSASAKGHATQAMAADGRVRREDKEGNDVADVLQQILAGFNNLRWLLMPDEICSESRRNGILGFWCCIGSWLPLLESPLFKVMGRVPI